MIPGRWTVMDILLACVCVADRSTELGRTGDNNNNNKHNNNNKYNNNNNNNEALSLF